MELKNNENSNLLKSINTESKASISTECPKCGIEIRSKENFCENCGANLTSMNIVIENKNTNKKGNLLWIASILCYVLSKIILLLYVFVLVDNTNENLGDVLLSFSLILNIIGFISIITGKIKYPKNKIIDIFFWIYTSIYICYLVIILMTIRICISCRDIA